MSELVFFLAFFFAAGLIGWIGRGIFERARKKHEMDNWRHARHFLPRKTSKS